MREQAEKMQRNLNNQWENIFLDFKNFCQQLKTYLKMYRKIKSKSIITLVHYYCFNSRNQWSIFFYWKNLQRIFWTVLVFFSSYNLWYGMRILCMLWKIIILLSKFESVSDTLFLALSISWYISKILFTVSFSWSYFLLDTFILSITTIFLTYAN